MFQQPVPDDHVIATGQSHSVPDFCDLAFSVVNLDYKDFVVADPRLYRLAEVNPLIGDALKARKVFGWKPQYSFRQLVTDMVETDLMLVRQRPA